jgi:hypothetical protein
MSLRKATNILLAGRTGFFASVATPLVNYGAVASSSGLNVYFMRKGEIESGISVMDPETREVVGVSKAAAEMGVWKTIYCRWIYLVPIFFTNPILEAFATALKVMPK